MGFTNNRSWGDAPQHPILPNAHRYAIVALQLELEPEDGSEPFLDLVLRQGAERRRLRFWSPQELEIERGGPVDTGGFEILDISSRGLEELGVLVSDSEGAGGGTVRFLARRVEEVRESE